MLVRFCVLTLVILNLFEETFINNAIAQVVGILPMEGQGPSNSTYGQCHDGCWWPGSHIIGPVQQEQYSCLSIKGVNTLRHGQTGCHFAVIIFKYIFLNIKKNHCIFDGISLRFILKCPINSLLVQLIAWLQTGGKPFPQPMVTLFTDSICLTSFQWVKVFGSKQVLLLMCL